MLQNLLFASLAVGVAHGVTVTTTATVWAEPTTQTLRRHPCDNVRSITLGTVNIWPYITTSTITSACVTRSLVYPVEHKPEPTVTATVTITRTETFTEIRNDRSTPTTRGTPTVVTRTMTTTRTDFSTKCTNTLVVSYFSTAPQTTTRTVYGTRITVTMSPKCTTARTRWQTLSGVSFVYPTTSTTMAWHDTARFNTTNVMTVSEAIPYTLTETFSTSTLTATTETCDNPTEHTTLTYYTHTVYLSTSEIYMQKTDCASTTTSRRSTSTTTTSVCSFTPSPIGYTLSRTPSPTPTIIVRRGPRDSELITTRIKRRQMPIDPPARTPIEVNTVSTTRTGVVNGTTGVYTLTGVAETYLWTITTIHMVGATVTVDADTVYRWVCSMPSTVATSPSARVARVGGFL